MERAQFNIKPWYDRCKARWGTNSLPPLEEIKATLSPQMSRCFGIAYGKSWYDRAYKKTHHNDYYQVNISRPWAEALKALCGKEVMMREMEHTIIHELAHISCFYTYPKRNVGHGYEWQELMQRMGMNSNRCHFNQEDINVPGTQVTWREIAQYKEEERGCGR